LLSVTFSKIEEMFRLLQIIIDRYLFTSIKNCGLLTIIESKA